jgi:MFS family permease
VETTVIAFSDFADAAVFAGVILAMWSIGSLTGGLIYGSIDFKMPLSKQLGLLGALLVPPALALPFVNSIWQLALLSVLAGFGVAPLLIAAASMAQQRAGDGRTTEAISSMYSGIGLGFAFAAAGAGLLIDNHGTEWAFFIGSMASLAITLLALVARKSLETPVGSQ